MTLLLAAVTGISVSPLRPATGDKNRAPRPAEGQHPLQAALLDPHQSWQQEHPVIPVAAVYPPLPDAREGVEREEVQPIIIEAFREQSRDQVRPMPERSLEAELVGLLAGDEVIPQAESQQHLIDRAEGEQDKRLRGELYQKADQMICKDESIIACTYLSTQNIMSKPWLHGIAVNALDLQFFKDAVIDNDWHP